MMTGRKPYLRSKPNSNKGAGAVLGGGDGAALQARGEVARFRVIERRRTLDFAAHLNL